MQRHPKEISGKATILEILHNNVGKNVISDPICIVEVLS